MARTLCFLTESPAFSNINLGSVAVSLKEM